MENLSENLGIKNESEVNTGREFSLETAIAVGKGVIIGGSTDEINSLVKYLTNPSITIFDDDSYTEELQKQCKEIVLSQHPWIKDADIDLKGKLTFNDILKSLIKEYGKKLIIEKKVIKEDQPKIST